MNLVIPLLISAFLVSPTAPLQITPPPSGMTGTLAQGAVAALMTGTTSTVVIPAVANQYLYITSCHLSNGSATATFEVLQAGMGGTSLNGPGNINPANGGSNLNYPSPLKVTPIGTGLWVQNATTGSSTSVDCQGFSSPVSY